MLHVKFQINLNFKPSDPAGDLVESSDDLEGVAGENTEEESEDSDMSVSKGQLIFYSDPE